MTHLEQTIIHLDDFMREYDYRYAIIGGMSVILHGLQRTTIDIDITLTVEIESMKLVAERCLQRFNPRKQNPIEFFERYFVLPVQDPTTGVGIDISAGIGGFDRNVVERAALIKIAGRMIPYCTIEDLLIYKIAANRDRDKSDVDFLIRLHKDIIDKQYLLNVAQNFVALDRSDILETIKKYFP
jgi:hypothetical protein